MTKIDYLAIIKKAWDITWENKFLWWFGFFIFLGGGFRFNYSFPNPSGQKMENGWSLFSGFLADEKSLAAAGAIFLILLIVFFIFISIRGKAAAIKSIGKIMKKEECDFSSGFRSGKKYFWKIFLTQLVLGFIAFGVFIILFIPVIFLFLLKAYLVGIVAAVLAVIILLPIIVLTAFINLYALIYIVLADLPIQESVENAYRLFRKNIIPSLIMCLFFIPFQIAILAATMLAGLTILFIFGPGTILAYLIFSKIGIIMIGAADIFLFLFLFAIINSIYNVFFQAVWILFFHEIAKQEKEEIVEETETYPVKMPKPEEAGL